LSAFAFVDISGWDTGIPPESDDHLGLVPGDEGEDWIYARFADGTLDITPRTPEGRAVRFFVDGSA
jgi:hypothetical protein